MENRAYLPFVVGCKEELLAEGRVFYKVILHAHDPAGHVGPPSLGAGWIDLVVSKDVFDNTKLGETVHVSVLLTERERALHIVPKP